MDTRVPLNRKRFEQLSDLELFQYILPEPLAGMAGKVGGGDQQLKARLISELSPGQQAILSFMVIYFHNVVGWHLFIYGFSTDIGNGLFDKIKTGLRYLEDTNLLHHVEKVEKRCSELGGIDPHENKFEDIDPEYEQIKEESFRIASHHIRTHKDEFYLISEE